MDGMRIYRALSGLMYQFREGKQPEGYVLVEPTKADEPTPEEQPKKRAPRNKARKADNK